MYVCGSSPTYMHLFIKTIMPRSSEGWTFFLAQVQYPIPDVNAMRQVYLASCGHWCSHGTCLPFSPQGLGVTQAQRHRCDNPISLDYSKDVIPGNLPEKEVKIGVDSEDGEDWKAFILGPKYKKRVFKKREREEHK